MRYKLAGSFICLVLSVSLYPVASVAQPFHLCDPPCALMINPPRCECPSGPRPGVHRRAPPPGQSNINRKNVPQTHQGKSPGPYD